MAIVSLSLANGATFSAAVDVVDVGASDAAFVFDSGTHQPSFGPGSGLTTVPVVGWYYNAPSIGDRLDFTPPSTALAPSAGGAVFLPGSVVVEA